MVKYTNVTSRQRRWRLLPKSSALVPSIQWSGKPLQPYVESIYLANSMSERVGEREVDRSSVQVISTLRWKQYDDIVCKLPSACANFASTKIISDWTEQPNQVQGFYDC